MPLVKEKKMRTVYRIVKYELPDDGSRDAWLAHTLKMSIDGRYELPNGCVITGVLLNEHPFGDEYGDVNISINELTHADVRPWFPPHADTRAKSRGDVE